MNYIEPIKIQLEEKLNEHCNMFKIIGTPNDTPRYYNFKNYNSETNILKVGSTQNNGLFFEIDCTKFKNEYQYILLDMAIFWEQFKKFRTDFLNKNHPTINIH